MKCISLISFLPLLFSTYFAEWIKLPEINIEHTTVKNENHFGVTSEFSSFIKLNMDKSNFISSSNDSISKSPLFLENFTNLYSTQNMTMLGKKLNGNVKKAIVKKNSSSNIDGDNTRSNDHSNLQNDQTLSENRFKVKNILENSVYKMSELTQIFKTIQKTIFANIPNAFKKKMEYLQTIHDNILINIENRISRIWPVSKRDKRGVKDGGHHMDFPSAESALMTISFLTFAVFLIKLVMQVINVLKAKKMMTFTPMVTAMGRSLHEPMEPGIGDETTARILRLMENFKNN